MSIFPTLAIALVALLHFGFLWLEMRLWTTPTGHRVFNLTPEFADRSKTLAANQGLYNGFLAAGLFWSLYPIGAPEAGKAIASFFLICVVVAGLYGGATVSRRILTIQAFPAIIALALLWIWPGY